MDISYIFNLKLFVYSRYLTITFIMPLLDLWLTSLEFSALQNQDFPQFSDMWKK